MDKFEYLIVYGKNVSNLLENISKQLDAGFYPHGNLVYVENNKTMETMNEEHVASGFYQPMVKEKLSEFVADFIK